MSFFNDPNRIPLNYGLRIAGGLIVYFLVMKVATLGHHVELRLLNLLILGVGIYFALKKFRGTHTGSLNYFRGLITGVSTGAIGSLVFGAFLFIYMKADADMMKSVVENEPMGHYLNAYMAAFIVALEGFFSGLLVTFVLLNWVDTDEVNNPQGESL
jgi:hypothetical protein